MAKEIASVNAHGDTWFKHSGSEMRTYIRKIMNSFPKPFSGGDFDIPDI